MQFRFYRKARARNFLLVTMPKSGTVFLCNALTANLGLKLINPLVGYFPELRFDPHMQNQFAKGGYLLPAHVTPSPLNIERMKEINADVLVHLRDPRAAILSWTHHVSSESIKRQYGSKMSPPSASSSPLPEGYYDWPLTARIDHEIDTWMAWYVTLAEEWAMAFARGTAPRRALLTHYEDMHSREIEFLREIMAHFKYPIPSEIKLAPRDASSHFRSGQKQEWKEVYTPEQADRAKRMIPKTLAAQFGWDY